MRKQGSLNGVRVALLVGLFATSGVMKLQPAGEPSGLLQAEPALGIAVAVFELILAGTLIWPRSRPLAALTGTVLLLIGGAYVALQPGLALPPCGCFGGRISLAPGWHILGTGIGIFLLADLLHIRSSRET